jgi:hypothetical protein
MTSLADFDFGGRKKLSTALKTITILDAVVINAEADAQAVKALSDDEQFHLTVADYFGLHIVASAQNGGGGAIDIAGIEGSWDGTNYFLLADFTDVSVTANGYYFTKVNDPEFAGVQKIRLKTASPDLAGAKAITLTVTMKVVSRG